MGTPAPPNDGSSSLCQLTHKREVAQKFAFTSVGSSPSHHGLMRGATVLNRPSTNDQLLSPVCGLIAGHAHKVNEHAHESARNVNQTVRCDVSCSQERTSFERRRKSISPLTAPSSSQAPDDHELDCLVQPRELRKENPIPGGKNLLWKAHRTRRPELHTQPMPVFRPLVFPSLDLYSHSLAPRDAAWSSLQPAWRMGRLPGGPILCGQTPDRAPCALWQRLCSSTPSISMCPPT